MTWFHPLAWRRYIYRLIINLGLQLFPMSRASQENSKHPSIHPPSITLHCALRFTEVRHREQNRNSSHSLSDWANTEAETAHGTIARILLENSGRQQVMFTQASLLVRQGVKFIFSWTAALSPLEGLTKQKSKSASSLVHHHNTNHD